MWIFVSYDAADPLHILLYMETNQQQKETQLKNTVMLRYKLQDSALCRHRPGEMQVSIMQWKAYQSGKACCVVSA